MALYSLCLIPLLTCVPQTHASQTPLLSQLLTPSSIHKTSSFYLKTESDVSTTSDSSHWNVTISQQSHFQFSLELDSSWGFLPNTKSSIQLTLSSPSIATGPETFDDLVFSFATLTTKQYVSVWIPMDNNGQKNRIYPACDESSTPTQSLGSGDVTKLLLNDRSCDVAGGDCSNWNTLRPKNAQFPDVYEYNQFPLTFVLENDPIEDTFRLYFHTAAFSESFTQQCGFVAMPSGEGLTLYIGGNDVGQSFLVSSLLVQSFANASASDLDYDDSDASNSLSSTVSGQIDQNKEGIEDRIDAEVESDGVDGKTGSLTVIAAIIGAVFVCAVLVTVVYIKCSSDDAKDGDDGDHVVAAQQMCCDEGTGSCDSGDSVILTSVVPARGVVEDDDEGEGMGEKGVTGHDVRWHNLNARSSVVGIDGLDIAGDGACETAMEQRPLHDKSMSPPLLDQY